MMKRIPIVTWATIAGVADNPMGLQRYELEVLEALRRASPNDLQVQTRTVGPFAARATADVAVPAKLLQRAPLTVARAVGYWAYRGVGLLHRLDLRLPPAPVPEVITVHDLPPLRFSDEGELPSWSVRSAQNARLIICPSEFAAREVRELLGAQRLAVVPNGVSPVFHAAQPLCAARLAAFKLSGPFVLHAGGATARKNLGGLARAWGRLAGELPAVSLALAGPPDPRRDQAFAGLPRVVRLGYLTPEEMAPLMAAALAVVVPSLYEGFGLPALEAMAAGAPVVAAGAGALPEVCGDAAVLVEPEPEAIARALVALAGDAHRRSELAAAGRARAASFSWDRAAQGHIAAYRLAFSDVIVGP